MLIDVHSHAQLGAHWGHEWDDHWKPIYGYDWVDTTPEAYSEAMNAAGVDLSFVFGIKSTAVGMTCPHDYIADFVSKVTCNTVGFMALDPSDPDAIEQMRAGAALGLKGIKLYPVLSLYDIREERFDPFYAEATKLGLIVLTHMGATPSPVGSLEKSNPLLVDEVARRHPDLTLIIAHMGHPWQRETMVVCRKNRHVYTDVSASWARPADGHRALIRAQEWGAVDKLLFGSDFPIFTPADAIAGIKAMAATRVEGLPPIAQETVDTLLDRDVRPLLRLE